MEKSHIMPLDEAVFSRVREAVPSDRAAIQNILDGTCVFSAVEIRCALELFDSYVRTGPDPNEYVFVCACDEGSAVLGFACYGKASLTDRVYDLYWIAAQPGCQGKQFGRRLLREVETQLERLGARMLMAETSSRPVYDRARRFYIRSGFDQICVIKDFYAAGDDLVMYCKRFDRDHTGWTV